MHAVFYFDYAEPNIFISYLVCLTIGPAFLCASIYLCLSRLVVVYGRNIARFSPAVYAVTFMICDFVSLVLQGTGGGLAATANTDSGSDAGMIDHSQPRSTLCNTC